MITAFTATRRSLLRTTVQFTSIIGIALTLASPQALATTDWQYNNVKSKHSKQQNFEIPELKKLEHKKNSFDTDQKSAAQSAIKSVIYKLDNSRDLEFFFDKNKNKGDKYFRKEDKYSHVLRNMQHNSDDWLKNKHGHNWQGNGWGHHKHDRDCGHDTPEVPIPAAVWLFGSAIGGLLTFRRFGKKATAC